MNDWDKIASVVFNLLTGYTNISKNLFQIRAYTNSGMETVVPEDARWFYVINPRLMIYLDDENGEIIINKSNNVDLSDLESLIMQLRQVALEYYNINVRIQTYDKNIVPKDFSNRAKRYLQKSKTKDVMESKFSTLYGRLKTSYQNLGDVKIVYKHSVPVKENSSKYRIYYIDSIFIEHAGNRYKFPVNEIFGARAMARHLTEGGEFDDSIAEYIIGKTQQYTKLKYFIKYINKNKELIDIDESVLQIAKNSAKEIKNNLTEFTKSSKYLSYMLYFIKDKDNIRDDVNGVELIKDKLTIKSFDDELESILPFINGVFKEKEQYESFINEQLNNFSLKRAFSSSSAFLFESKNSELVFSLNEISLICESERLSVFLSRVSEKISTNQNLDPFEIKVVRNIFDRILGKISD